MFRLLAANQAGFRPVIMRKVRGNAGRLTNVEFDKTPLQLRTNASAPLAKADGYFAKAKTEAVFTEALHNPAKMNRFEELLVTAKQVNPHQSRTLHKQYFETIHFLFNMIKDDQVKDHVLRANMLQYAMLLNHSAYQNRTLRLSKNRNRDSDLYLNNTLNNDVMLKLAILDLADNLAGGRFKLILDANILQTVLMAMVQFKMFNEMLLLWEAGVNDDEVCTMYLSQRILAIILPVAYDEGRFDYDQVKQVYEMNTKHHEVSHDLLGSMGKIAIRAGDYERGLDCLEALLTMYEKDKLRKKQISRPLLELHLTFIGSCKDMKIARHFFDKAVESDLPYWVVLKAPHVAALLENCVDAGESVETLFYFWKTTMEHYVREKNQHAGLNARYAIINNLFFALFFRMFPELTLNSYLRLKEVIFLYSNIKPVDELFLNTVISNYAWHDKVVFQQLVENYTTHNVQRTPVAYRVILKKMGSIHEFLNAEILDHWNESLAHLDTVYLYIPIADWAALRDATILSPFSNERKEFYLAVLDAYKNYHQDSRACVRFAKYWLSKADHVQDVARVSLEENPKFDAGFDIVVPPFKKLTENVDYRKVTAPMFAHVQMENQKAAEIAAVTETIETVSIGSAETDIPSEPTNETETVSTDNSLKNL